MTTVNPTTGLTDQQILDSSNAVAQRAATMLGGTWEQGYQKTDGSVGGGYTSGITSSGSVTEKNNTNNAIIEAANKLTTSPYNTNQNNFPNNYSEAITTGMNMANDQFNQSMQVINMAKKSLDMTYNANLASMNHQYGQLFQQMAQQHEKMVQVAEFNAQSLNPYSQAAGAQTAQNFTGEITRKYQAQAIALQQQADIAQRQLQAGHFQAYVGLQESMTKMAQQFQQQMLGFMMENMKVQEEARRFEVQERRANIGQYVNFLSEPLPSPQEIEAMSDQQLMQLTAVQQGLRSGYDINGIRQDLLNASNMQLSQSALAAEDREMKWAEFESNQAYRKAQIDNIYNQIQNRNKESSGSEKPITWNQYLNMRQNEAGQTFTAERIEQERKIFFTLYNEKGMPTYDEKSLPGTLRSSIIEEIKYAQQIGDEMTLEKLARYYPEVGGEVLKAMLLDPTINPAPIKESWWSKLTN